MKPETAAAFDRYIQLTEAEMQARSPQNFLWIDQHRKEKTMVWLSQDVIEPRETLDHGQKIEVPDGAIQHWYAAIYLETGTLDRVRDMLLGYADYKNFFKQQVLDSRLVKRDGDNFDAFLRLSKKQVTQVVLNVDLSSKYTTVDPMRATHCEPLDAHRRGAASRQEENLRPGVARQRPERIFVAAEYVLAV